MTDTIFISNVPRRDPVPEMVQLTWQQIASEIGFLEVLVDRVQILEDRIKDLGSGWNNAAMRRMAAEYVYEAVRLEHDFDVLAKEANKGPISEFLWTCAVDKNHDLGRRFAKDCPCKPLVEGMPVWKL